MTFREGNQPTDDEVAARIEAERYTLIHAALVEAGLQENGEFAGQETVEQPAAGLPTGEWRRAEDTLRQDKVASIGRVVRALRSRYN